MLIAKMHLLKTSSSNLNSTIPKNSNGIKIISEKMVSYQLIQTAPLLSKEYLKIM